MSDLRMYCVSDDTLAKFSAVKITPPASPPGDEVDPLPTFQCGVTDEDDPGLIGVIQRAVDADDMAPVKVRGWSYCLLGKPSGGWSEATIGSMWGLANGDSYATKRSSGTMKLIGWKSTPTGLVETGIVLLDGSGGLPSGPAEGDYVLMSQDGVVDWVEVQPFSCPY